MRETKRMREREGGGVERERERAKKLKKKKRNGDARTGRCTLQPLSRSIICKKMRMKMVCVKKVVVLRIHAVLSITIDIDAISNSRCKINPNGNKLKSNLNR